MAQNSNIEWCDHTANFWSGCTKVSPACAHCYAESLAKRFPHFGQWGAGAPRTWHGKNAAKDIRKWSAAHFQQRLKNPTARRPRVFINSLSDWLDDEIPIDWLASLLDAIRLAPNLDFLLLTKRPENFRPRLEQILKYIPRTGIEVDHAMLRARIEIMLNGWAGYQYIAPELGIENYWIGTTVENHEMAAKRIPQLLNIPAKIRFLSCEPLLGPLNIQSQISNIPSSIHWIICGGESGPHARPMHPDWARSLRDQCTAASVPFLFKQWGEWLPICCDPPEWRPTPDCEDWHKGRQSIVLQRDGRIENAFPPGAMTCIRVGKKAAGRILDGIEHNAFPTACGL